MKELKLKPPLLTFRAWIWATGTALDLKPNYVRAWANMGISYTNQLKELKEENQAKAKKRSSSSRVGTVLPNTKFLGLVSFCVIGPSLESSHRLASFGTFFLVGLGEHFGMYRLLCCV
ncbi:hypothetical protein V6Z12_A11G274800 [Gossypium hirsutum]